jgi:hypothetical protein
MIAESTTRGIDLIDAPQTVPNDEEELHNGVLVAIEGEDNRNSDEVENLANADPWSRLHGATSFLTGSDINRDEHSSTARAHLTLLEGR